MINQSIKNKINSRFESNIEILDVIKKYCETYPDMRFGQALANLDIIEYDHTLMNNPKDPFFDESCDILKRIPEKYKK